MKNARRRAITCANIQGVFYFARKLALGPRQKRTETRSWLFCNWESTGSNESLVFLRSKGLLDEGQAGARSHGARRLSLPSTYQAKRGTSVVMFWLRRVMYVA